MSTKIGIVLLLLVVMHFLNVYGFAKMRSNSLNQSDSITTNLPERTEEDNSDELVYSLELDDRLDSESADKLQPAMNSTGH